MTVPHKGGRPRRTGPARIVVNARFTPELLAEVEAWPGDPALRIACVSDPPDRHSKIMRLIRLGLTLDRVAAARRLVSPGVAGDGRTP